MRSKFGQMTEEQSKSLINRIQTVMLVHVKSVNATGVNPVGTVDVQPMVAQLDSDGIAHEHGIYKAGKMRSLLILKWGILGCVDFVVEIFPR
ncbi:hypothetical protein ACLSYX_02550 [[Pasteurella] aerogenes]